MSREKPKTPPSSLIGKLIIKKISSKKVGPYRGESIYIKIDIGSSQVYHSPHVDKNDEQSLYYRFELGVNFELDVTRESLDGNQIMKVAGCSKEGVEFGFVERNFGDLVEAQSKAVTADDKIWSCELKSAKERSMGIVQIEFEFVSGGEKKSNLDKTEENALASGKKTFLSSFMGSKKKEKSSEALAENDIETGGKPKDFLGTGLQDPKRYFNGPMPILETLRSDPIDSKNAVHVRQRKLERLSATNVPELHFIGQVKLIPMELNIIFYANLFVKPYPLLTPYYFSTNSVLAVIHSLSLFYGSHILLFYSGLYDDFLNYFFSSLSIRLSHLPSSFPLLSLATLNFFSYIDCMRSTDFGRFF